LSTELQHNKPEIPFKITGTPNYIKGRIFPAFRLFADRSYMYNLWLEAQQHQTSNFITCSTERDAERISVTF